ncbi:MAG: SOS response-associated peptidase [Candidatus Woesearchaeota archaeon]
MCGRWTLTLDKKTVEESFHATLPDDYQPRYNIAPTQQVPILRSDNKDFTNASWGLIPSWSKDDKIAFKTINARAESLLEKPAFKIPFQKKRCLIPADSFYEWKKTPQAKLPYRFVLNSRGIFAFAGIYDERLINNERSTSFSIITVEPNSIVKPIHTRMPAILLPEQHTQWLTENNPEKLLAFLKPYPSNLMESYPVSSLVNSPKNDTIEVIKPLSQLNKFFT